MMPPSRTSRHQALFLVAITLLLLVTVSATAAQNKAQAEKELKILKSTIADIQETLRTNLARQSKAQQNIRHIDKKLAEASAKLRTTRQQITQANDKLKQLEVEQREKTSLREKQRQRLASQLRSAYIAGRQEYVKLLLNQEDPTKVSRMLEYYRYLNQARIDDIKELQQTLQRLTVIEQDIQTTLVTLSDLKEAQETQQQKQSTLKKEQQIALNKLKRSYSNQNSRLEKLRKDEQELAKVIKSIEKALRQFAPKQSLTGLGKFKKKLQWPASGSIIHRYGSNKLGKRLKWNGILIGAQEGDSVHAIHHGQVVFADWLRGYGLVVIVDHGKGYLSLYGQNQSLLKSPGDWVEAGEPVATSGGSGGSGQPGLYFEIRYKGRPQNPVAWIR
ncbi:murein hydrolase activator EnvC family protein [Kangiella shandongensis]|uniref:murein hydrolase activator EnvC family protein n=1 Tax=Kangiella shandongensis TaxID=2763258 RepID=UPI001CBFBCE6|nr:peptidoglycan DD-metalloendopeptidase family protein [Kangiella shandongensis]